MMKREVTLVSCFIFRRSDTPFPGEKLENVCCCWCWGWGMNSNLWILRRLTVTRLSPFVSGAS